MKHKIRTHQVVKKIYEVLRQTSVCSFICKYKGILDFNVKMYSSLSQRNSWKNAALEVTCFNSTVLMGCWHLSTGAAWTPPLTANSPPHSWPPLSPYVTERSFSCSRNTATNSVCSLTLVLSSVAVVDNSLQLEHPFQLLGTALRLYLTTSTPSHVVQTVQL